MTKRNSILVEISIIVIALFMGIYSQFPSFINEYIINDDVRQHIYWMLQFQDSTLFENDLLTEYAKNYQPWGFIAFYYIFSFVINPMILSKVLPIILLGVSTLYLFKLTKHLTNTYSAILAATIYLITPIFFNRMIGGEPRAFGYPLLIIFLYYLVKKEHLKSSVILIVQCLFYPFIFLLSISTYLLTFIRIQRKRIFIEKAILNKYFLFAIIIAGSILISKHIVSYNADIGHVVTRKQMIGNPEYYPEGRYGVLPTPNILDEITKDLKNGMYYPKIFEKPSGIITIIRKILSRDLFLIVIVLFLIYERIKKRLIFPRELILLIVASVLMYLMADLFLFRLFLPIRYTEYSLSLIGLLICAIAIGGLVIKIKNTRTKKTIQVLIIIVIFLNIGNQRSNGLIDMTPGKELFSYLNKLPKKTLIVAHPHTADGIPTFALRKVFIKHELSHCVFDNYWKTIKKRTYDFFDAYYSEDPAFIYNFCNKNGIDYLVVDKRHFTERYFGGNIYFEPFNTYVENIGRTRKDFFLDNIPKEKKLFEANNIFVINKSALLVADSVNAE